VWTPQKIAALSSTTAQQVSSDKSQGYSGDPSTPNLAVQKSCVLETWSCESTVYTGLQTIPCTPLQISCSLDSSLVLTTADQGAQVLTFGDNSLRQLGREDVHANQSPIAADAWALFDSDKKPLSALHITAGLSHAMAVLCSGQVEYSADL